MLQWGHVQSDVETGTKKAILRVVVSLQWGHVQSDVETDTRMWGSGGHRTLQWGHVQSDVETLVPGINSMTAMCASMGPRPIRRGNLMTIDATRQYMKGFNGATSNQTWKQ